MAIRPLLVPAFDPNANAFDFSPLARLGQYSKPDDKLANLATQYASAPSAPSTSTPTPGGTTAAFTAPPTSSDVDAAIRATAPMAGMDVPTWKAMASIESSLNPSSNYSQPTQYKGLFQIGSRGDGSEWSRHGGSGNIYDAMDNATAAAKLAAENNSRFKDAYGRDPSPTETYMMHQQGFGFYKNGTMTNVAGNPYPGMSGPQTPQSFEQGWGREIQRRADYFRKSEKGQSGDDNGD